MMDKLRAANKRELVASPGTMKLQHTTVLHVGSGKRASLKFGDKS